MNQTMRKIADAVSVAAEPVGHKPGEPYKTAFALWAENAETRQYGERYRVTEDGRVFYWGTLVAWPDTSKPGNMAFSTRGYDTPTTIKVINAALDGFGRPDVRLGMHKHSLEIRIQGGPHGMRCFYVRDVAAPGSSILTVGKSGDPEKYTGL